MASKTQLSSRHEIFIQALIRGKTQRQAYYEAYPHSRNWTDGTVDCKASVLFANDKVKVRYNELLGKVNKEAVLTREQILVELSTIALNSKECTRDRLNALDKLAKTYGMFIDKSVNENTNINKNLLGNLDEETLRKLADGL